MDAREWSFYHIMPFLFHSCVVLLFDTNILYGNFDQPISVSFSHIINMAWSTKYQLSDDQLLCLQLCLVISYAPILGIRVLNPLTLPRSKSQCSLKSSCRRNGAGSFGTNRKPFQQSRCVFNGDVLILRLCRRNFAKHYSMTMHARHPGLIAPF